MMIGGEFNTSADWVRAGEAVATVDAFAASHGGMAPVLVFADPSGGFAVDTECVNGVRGNAADHLTKDVVPHMISTFGVSADRAHWAVAGFSSGGTCALNLAVMHPDLFAGFLAIAGDDRPNAGTDAQTVERLFGGDRDAWLAFDPRHTIARHGVYAASWGLFTVPRRADSGVDRDAAAAANGLCALAASRSIACTVTSVRGRHDWPFAAAAFKVALPWLAGQIQTPGVPTSAPP
jgi:S-formylglutathione hydrolase FrmB